jgi:peptide/nickel transport system ATP-binding protein
MTIAVSVRDAVVTFGNLRAVDGVSLDVREGGCFGIVGESGSGKTTLMRTILGLQLATSGSIFLAGLARHGNARARGRYVQAIFQDPASSLSPRRSIGQSLDEVGELLNESKDSLRIRVAAILGRMGLSSSVSDKYPYQLSGGQARRVALARALLVRPKILIADEPTAGLDVSVQGDLLNLLQELRQESGLTLIVVSHNLAVVRLIADDAAVMHRGQLVEQGPSAIIFEAPRSNYMRQLLNSWPRVVMNETDRF